MTPRRFRWLLECSAILALTWYGFHLGNTFAAGALKFLVWFAFIASLLLAFITPDVAARSLQKQGPPAPIEVNLFIDLAIAGLMAATGHWGYATMYLVANLLVSGLYQRPLKDEGVQA
jgi:hypothetical protein